MVYVRRVEERYGIDLDGIDELTRLGIGWQPVIEMLNGPGRSVRGHIGAFLQIIKRDRYGRLLVVALLEEEDDFYSVQTARELHGAEAAAVAKLIGEDE
jgi:hypothetical protein